MKLLKILLFGPFILFVTYQVVIFLELVSTSVLRLRAWFAFIKVPKRSFN